jgi:rhodanese-related sulfurtransferase
MNQLVAFANKHPLIVAGVIAAWLAVMFYELTLRRRGLTNISANDAVRLINKGALVIDVRDSAKFGAGHIVNARNVALERLQQDEDAIDKKKNKVLVTVCDNGSMSAKAASLLRKAGYENVFSLRGGLGTWRAENLPLVK